MRLVQRCSCGFFGALFALALVACKTNHVDRDGYAERNFDRSGAINDRAGASTDDHVGTASVTGADLGGMSNDLAIERIVGARCARETACNNVGADKHFVSPEVCARELHSRIGDDLKPAECPRGLDEAALDKCMDAIRTESCSNPTDAIQRLAACRTSDLCIKKK